MKRFRRLSLCQQIFRFLARRPPSTETLFELDFQTGDVARSDSGILNPCDDRDIERPGRQSDCGKHRQNDVEATRSLASDRDHASLARSHMHHVIRRQRSSGKRNGRRGAGTIAATGKIRDAKLKASDDVGRSTFIVVRSQPSTESKF